MRNSTRAGVRRLALVALFALASQALLPYLHALGARLRRAGARLRDCAAGASAAASDAGSGSSHPADCAVCGALAHGGARAFDRTRGARPRRRPSPSRASTPRPFRSRRPSTRRRLRPRSARLPSPRLEKSPLDLRPTLGGCDGTRSLGVSRGRSAVRAGRAVVAGSRPGGRDAGSTRSPQLQARARRHQERARPRPRPRSRRRSRRSTTSREGRRRIERRSALPTAAQPAQRRARGARRPRGSRR